MISAVIRTCNTKTVSEKRVSEKNGTPKSF